MHKKLLIIMITILFVLTGCVRLTDNLSDTINEILKNETTSVNTVSTGYELYIPIGVTQVTDNEYNQKFKIRDRYIYLYVDTVSYYYKSELNYKKSSDYNYYYYQISNNGKTGYVGINKVDDDSYFCVIVYNYSKIEFYSDLNDLPIIFANSLIIQNSIKFNDELIKLELESNITDGREIKYELDKPVDSESTFSQYLQEYVAEEGMEVELPDDN